MILQGLAQQSNLLDIPAQQRMSTDLHSSTQRRDRGVDIERLQSTLQLRIASSREAGACEAKSGDRVRIGMLQDLKQQFVWKICKAGAIARGLANGRTLPGGVVVHDAARLGGLSTAGAVSEVRAVHSRACLTS